MNELKGIKFPFRVANGKVAVSSGEQHLKESIAQIILCNTGVYIMLPDFGSNIPRRVFDPISMLGIISTDVKEALKKWEARVEFTSVKVRVF